PTRSKKIKAMLAGGLVLGVGATVTLASWSDQAFVDGVFRTSTFGIEARTTPTAEWQEAETEASAVDLTLETSLARELQPGATVYTPLELRTVTGSVAGTVTLEGAEPVGEAALFEALTYTVVESATCDATAVAASTDALVPGGAELTQGSDAGVISVGANSTEPVTLCFAFTLPDTADDPTLQGLDATAQWRFAAESVEAA
ncbi:SipW-dependent-type signal peptide-containing protein, partial [Georgenia sp. 10Sc9-8]|nr:SipW-dependent-type signal peptide-containing protein [Georgenia halotolerans]